MCFDTFGDKWCGRALCFTAIFYNSWIKIWENCTDFRRLTASGTGAIVGGTKAKGGDRIDAVAMTILWILSSVSDLQEYRIPNDLILAGWLAALVCRLYMQGISGMGAGICCIITGILILLPVYGIHGMGAGDVKLLSVIGGMYGMKFWAQTGIVFAFLAAIFSFVHMWKKHIFVNRICYFFRFVILERKGKYYDASRDGREMVISLSPVLAVAYYIVLLWDCYM